MFRQADQRSGWTAGAGIEVALAPRWSARLEYLHVDLGSMSAAFTAAGVPTVMLTASQQMDLVRAGINYRF